MRVSSNLLLIIELISTTKCAAAFCYAGAGCIVAAIVEHWCLQKSFDFFPLILVFVCVKEHCSSLAISLTVSFNGVSAALYTLAANAIDPSSDALYLLLNAAIPLITSIVALFPILRQPDLYPLPPDAVQRDSLIFLFLNFLAVLTGMYLLFLGSSSESAMAGLLLSGAIFLLVLPMCIPGVVYAKDWFHRTVHTSFQFEGSGFLLVDDLDLEVHKDIVSRDSSLHGSLLVDGVVNESGTHGSSLNVIEENKGCCETMIGKDQLAMLGEEHSAKLLVRRMDFWLYYTAYFCGGTIGLVYSNNLGQIAQSLGQSSMTSRLITIYSSFSFFGRLLSAVPDYIRAKFYFARTGWLTLALLPTPVAFFLLAGAESILALQAGTALIGLSSGFIFAAAVSVTSELFGPFSVGLNHNILISNIPIGSLAYGLLAAIVYDSNAGSSITMFTSDAMVCLGRRCYFLTFILWGCFAVLGCHMIDNVVLIVTGTLHVQELLEKCHPLPLGMFDNILLLPFLGCLLSTCPRLLTFHLLAYSIATLTG
uniref:Nodulin-like domain-containing protein n=1 Tax=Kalanchoe fedtschenkoi TaxID=63787 RepID=A0A7N0RA67_KALFE